MKVSLIILMLAIPLFAQEAVVDTTIAPRELPFFNGMILPDSLFEDYKEPPKIESKKDFKYVWFGVGIIES